MTFDAVVCGAGIGGLATALALRRQGIPVTVLEQSPEVREVGAGLQIGPNATAALTRLGLRDVMMSLSLEVQETVQRRWRDGSVIAKTTLGPGATVDYGAPYLQLHRADLQQALLAAAIDPAGAGPQVTVVTGVRVGTVDDSDPLRPAAIAVEGTRYEGSVLIGADGIKSVIRDSVGAPSEIVDSGDMCFRTLIDGAAIAADPATRFLVDWQAGHFWFGPDRHLIAYPVRDYSAINIVGIVPITDEVARDWRRPSSTAELVAAYEGWDPRLVSALTKADGDIVLWALKHQEPHSVWTAGRLALVGDACHAMLPYVSQGASQAIEDGVVLAEELGAVPDDDIPAALLRYVERRAERAEFVQRAALANRTDFHLHDGPEQIARDKRLRSDHRAVGASLDWIYRGTPARVPEPATA